MTFERPWFLLTLLALPLLALLYVWLQRRRSRYPVSFTNLAVLREVVGTRRPWRRWVAPVLVLLALAALLVGVARPQVDGMVPQDRATVVLVLDVSRSMEARDVKPNRIGAAKRAIRLFLDRAPDRLRVGMVVFAGVPQVASPPTTDHEQVSVSLDNLGDYATFGGTAIGDALSMAVDVGRDAIQSDPEAPAGERCEREQARLDPLPLRRRAARGRAPAAGGSAAREGSRDAGLHVALGTPNGTVAGGGGGFFPFAPERIPVPPDTETLRAIAETTGGEFTEARDAETVDNAYEKLGSNLGRRRADKEVTYVFLGVACGAARRRRCAVGALVTAPALARSGPQVLDADVELAREPFRDQRAMTRLGVALDAEQRGRAVLR
jgi:Ca-activated chloride channel family protein